MAKRDAAVERRAAVRSGKFWRAYISALAERAGDLTLRVAFSPTPFAGKRKRITMRLLFLGLVAGFFLVACGRDGVVAGKPAKPNAADEGDGKPVAAGSASIAAMPKVYGIKSGVVEYRGSVAGMPFVETKTFDDWGRKEVVVRETTTIHPITKKPLSKVKSATIHRGLRQILIDFKKKTATQTDLRSRQGVEVDIAALEKDKGKEGATAYLERHKMKLLPAQDFMGISCQVIATARGRGQQQMWSYKGVLLKMLVEQKLADKKLRHVNANLTMEATAFEPNAAVDPKVFEVPRWYRTRRGVDRERTDREST